MAWVGWECNRARSIARGVGGLVFCRYLSATLLAAPLCSSTALGGVHWCACGSVVSGTPVFVFGGRLLDGLEILRMDAPRGRGRWGG